MLEIPILPVEDHEASNAAGEEVVFDLLTEGIGGSGTDDVVHHRIHKSGVDP